MASLGAKVLQVRSVELAMLHNVPTYVRSSFDDPADPKQGTLICDEDEIMEQQVVTGIAYSRDEAQITLRNVADKPGVAASIFVPLAEANINVDMIIQVVSDDNATTDLTFTVPAADYERACAVLQEHRSEIAFRDQVLGPDRHGLHRARGPDAPLALRPRQDLSGDTTYRGGYGLRDRGPGSGPPGPDGACGRHASLAIRPATGLDARHDVIAS